MSDNPVAALATQAPQGAFLLPEPAQPIVLRPHPFSQDHGVIAVRAGRTIAQMLDEATQGAEIALTVRVEIVGREVPRALWAKVRPKPGVALHVTRMPAGGDSGKKWLRTILLIVVAVVAIAVTGGWGAGFFSGMGLTAAQAGALVFMVGSLIVNALVPPPQPRLGGGFGGMGEAERLNMLTGSSNQLNPYGPIPLVIGETRMFPPHAAMPYSESMGRYQYQRLMFDLGYGDIEVSDIRIGDTPLAEFEDVEYEITTTPTLYTDDVNEQTVSVQMNDGDNAVRTTAPNIDEISLDIIFPQGLFGVTKQGVFVGADAQLFVSYRRVGTARWHPAPLSDHQGTTAPPRMQGFYGAFAREYDTVASTRAPDRKPFAVTAAWSVERGQYEVRVIRGTTNWGGADPNSQTGDAVWSVMRSIRQTNPSKTGTTKLAMRIKATEQLNGTLQTLSCLVRQRIPVYDPATSTWSAPQFNLNPAWVLHWLLTACPAFAIKVPADRVDLPSLIDYAAFCTEHDFEVRGTLDARVTARQLIDDVLACSLGALTLRDGKYGVLFDHGDTVPTMVFTPLDTRNFNVSRVFNRMPHALRVRFRNPAADWQMDEIVVVDDGYAHQGRDAHGNTLNSLTRATANDVRVTQDGKVRSLQSEPDEPTEFESIELRMAADAHQAWRVGRHHFAQAKYRPNVYSWETDIANLACVRGDLVHVAHDVIEWGDGWGQITSIADATLTFDETLTLSAATNYSARIRRQDGTSEVLRLVNVADGDTNSITLETAPQGANVGDIVVVGETTRETKALLITGIQPSADLGARITAVEYDARVEPYWSNPPVEIFSEVTGTAYRDPPPPPNITVIVSDPINDTPNDSGSTTPEVHIGVGYRSGYLQAGGSSRSGRNVHHV
jgi:hypothetical protein